MKKLENKTNTDIILLEHYIRKQDVATVRSLLEEDIDLESKDLLGRTALHYAAEVGNKEIVKMLLDKGIDPNITDNDGITPLYVAIRTGNVEIVKVLIDNGANINSKNTSKQTPLYLAIKSKNKDMINLLISEGAIDNMTDKQLYIALEELINKDNIYDILELIINKYKEKRKKFKYANKIASKVLNHPKLVKLLMEITTDINEPLYNCYTLLNKALGDACLESAKVLLEMGSDPNIEVYSSQLTNMEYATYYSGEVVKLLIDYGYDIHKRDIYNQTPLMYAVRKGNVEAVKILLEAGADINVMNIYGHTLFTMCGNKEIEKMLLDKLNKDNGNNNI